MIFYNMYCVLSQLVHSSTTCIAAAYRRHVQNTRSHGRTYI